MRLDARRRRPGTAPPARGAARRSGSSLWLSRRAVVAHLALAVWVPGCATAAWWQVGIALGGDALGWVYAVMWPCFAVFGTVFWWFLVHDDPETLGRRGLRAAGAHGPGSGRLGPGGGAEQGEPDDEARRLAEAESADAELAAYNAYLSSLQSRPKSWRRR